MFIGRMESSDFVYYWIEVRLMVDNLYKVLRVRGKQNKVTYEVKVIELIEDKSVGIVGSNTNINTNSNTNSSNTNTNTNNTTTVTTQNKGTTNTSSSSNTNTTTSSNTNTTTSITNNNTTIVQVKDNKYILG